MTERGRVLVVDDERGMRDLLSGELGSQGYHVATAADGAEAVDLLRRGKFDVVVSDVKMPRLGGLALLEAVKLLDSGVEVIMSTGYGSVETAVEAMKKGAYDFVQKPFDLDEILAVVDKAREKSEIRGLLSLYQDTRAVFGTIKLDELLPTMASVSARIFGADEVVIALVRPGAGLDVAAAAGPHGTVRAEYGRGLCERLMRLPARPEAPAVILGPLGEDARFADLPGASQVRASVAVTIWNDGRPEGVLVANRTGRGGAYGASDLRHAGLFGGQVAQALHNARLYAELETRMREIKAMQLQLIRSEKLAAIGQLAAGVAHEINNPLTGIMGLTELLLDGGNLTPGQHTDLAAVLHQSRRCRRIVQDLLQFGRRREPALELMAVQDVIEPILALVERDLRSAGIAVRIELPGDLPPIHGDRSQLEQVALNLVINARHAMQGSGGGLLSVRASSADGTVCIRFEDTGCGIPPEDLARVFDPFFTTKPMGQGTGLGLSVSHGIVQQHRGRMRVESRVGIGTAFIIELPAGRS